MPVHAVLVSGPIGPGSRGRTVLALSRGAQRAGTALEADARQLGELADSIEGLRQIDDDSAADVRQALRGH